MWKLLSRLFFRCCLLDVHVMCICLVSSKGRRTWWVGWVRANPFSKDLAKVVLLNTNKIFQFPPQKNSHLFFLGIPCHWQNDSIKIFCSYLQDKKIWIFSKFIVGFHGVNRDKYTHYTNHDRYKYGYFDGSQNRRIVNLII